MMKEFASWVVARLQEPSTYAGLASLLLALHVADSANWAGVIQTAAIGLAGVVAMAMKEAS